jgi:hypothetical protein
MDATRKRRTRDRARQEWYAHCRQRRFARFLGFLGSASVFPPVSWVPIENVPAMVRGARLSPRS